MFDALVFAEARKRRRADGSIGKKVGFVSTSKDLADGFERLANSLGYPTSRGIEKDSRPHVTSTNYRVSLLFTRYRHTKNSYGAHWFKENYDGMVYCATVPGGLLYTRRGHCTSGIWTGNSEKIGIDARLAHGVRIGSDGQLYQQFRNARTKQLEWMTPSAIENSVVRIPD